MAARYDKLYTYLVGEIDDVLQLICYDLLKGQYGRDELAEVGEKLRSALHEAEEMYLEDTEGELITSPEYRLHLPG